jgi:hypothetical protein
MIVWLLRLYYRGLFLGKVLMRIDEIIVDVIESIPRGQTLDENDVIGHLISNHREDYLAFLAGYAHTNKPMELAAAAIAGEIEKYEGIFVEKQETQPAPAGLCNITYKCTVWKRI